AALQHHLRRCDDAACLRPATQRAAQHCARLGRPLSPLCSTPDRAGAQFCHRRHLLVQPSSQARPATRGEPPVVFINLIFLSSIVLFPAGNGLYGNYGQSSAVAMLYALHLTLIATLNAWLWWLVPRDRRLHHELAGAVFPLLVFLPGIALAGLAPR